ncbi:MAG: sulfatase [Acidobacteriota bacterium]|nr:sulfatase [Acidobacteriota bacterium]
MNEFGISWRLTGWAVATALCFLGALTGCGDGATVTNPADLEGEPVIFDFVERLPAARVFEESTFVDLGKPAAGRSLRTGWGGDESKTDGTTYVWAVSQRAELDLVVVNTAASRLHFRAWPFMWDGAPDQIATVFVNDRKIGSVRLEPRPRDYSFHLPRGVLWAGVNRVVFDFTYTQEARAHRQNSSDHRKLAAAFDFVGIGRKSDATGAGDAGLTEPVVRENALVLAPGSSVVYALHRTSPTILSFGLDVDGTQPSDSARVLVWAKRAGEAPVELLAADLDRVVGGPYIYGVDPGEGRLEIGFAVTGGATTGAAAKWNLVVSEPLLHAEELAAETIINVLMVVVDTLRADRLGVYGSELETPNIDRLAARGVTFEHAYSHIPITGPSHSSIFTSLIPAEHGVHNNGQILATDIPVMAEILRDDGRNTAAAVSLGVLKGRFGFGRGFDTYLDEFRHDWMKDAGEVNAEVKALLDGGLPEPFFLWVHYSDPHEPYAPPNLEYPRVALELNGEPVGELTAGGRGEIFDLELLPGRNSLRFTEVDATGRTLFKFSTMRFQGAEVDLVPASGWRVREKRVGSNAYVGRLPAAVELHSPADGRRRVGFELACQRVQPQPELVRNYELEVEYVDREIGRLLAFMEQRQLLENTLVVFLSDHGEGLGNHRHFGHISQLYNSLLHVAFIAAFPGHLPEGLVIDEPVAMVDVLPTVLDLMDLESPDRINGASLLPLIRGDGGAPRAIVAETYRPEAYSEKRALVLDGFKYIHSWTDDHEWEELYDLENDPGELHELSAIEVERLTTMREALQTRLLAAVPAEVVEAELSSEEIERLRALGYIH